MNQDTYSVMIFWSDDDAAFVASVPDLPGCMAHGETRAEAAEQIGIAIQNWIETAREIGRQIPSPPKDMALYIKELDQKTAQTIKAGLENAMPSLVETVVKVLKQSEANERQEMTPHTAVLYARVSSREQREEGYSIEAQVKLLRAAASALLPTPEMSYARVIARYIMPNARNVTAIEIPANARNSGSFHIWRARGVLASHPALNPPAKPPMCAQKSTPGMKLSTRP